MAVIYDIGKDTVKGGMAIIMHKKSVVLELKLNLKFLADFSKNNYHPDKNELIKMVSKLRVDAIEELNRSGFSKKLITTKKVTKNILGNIPAPRTLGNDLNTLLDKLYLMISYIKQDYDKKGLNLFVRLKNIYNYSRITLKLLEKK